MTKVDFEVILDKAFEAAKTAATDYLNTHGDRPLCGFAWVKIGSARGGIAHYGNKKYKEGVAAGKTYTELAAIENRYGSKSWNKGWEFWNPSGLHVQSVEVLEAGAVAFAKVLREHGINASAGSRLD